VTHKQERIVPLGVTVPAYASFALSDRSPEQLNGPFAHQSSNSITLVEVGVSRRHGLLV